MDYGKTAAVIYHFWQLQVKILHVSTIRRFSRNWTNEFALKNRILLRKKESHRKKVHKKIYMRYLCTEEFFKLCTKEIKVNYGGKNRIVKIIYLTLNHRLLKNVSIISWASSKSARREEEWKATVSKTNSLISRLLTLCPDKRPRGEDPPTKFLCVCRGPSVDSTNSFELVCVTGFFEILTAGQTMSSNYRRCAMIGPGEPSTETLPESLGISVVSIDLTYTKSDVIRSSGMPPEVRRCLFANFTFSLRLIRWYLATRILRIPDIYSRLTARKKANSYKCLIRHFCITYFVSLEIKLH